MKTLFGMKLGGRVAALALGLAALAMPSAVIGQGTEIAIHGKVTNPAGSPIKTGDVKLATVVPGSRAADPKDLTYQKDFPIDASGMYKGSGIAPGDYIAVAWSEGKAVDFQKITLKAGDDKTVDFDMTREEYQKGMSEDERKALEEYKKKNAATVSENAKIQNINAVLTQAAADQKAGKPDDAVTALQGVIALRPNEAIIWGALAQAQLASADLAYKSAKAANTPTNDPAIVQKYSDSAASYQKAIDFANGAAKKPSPEILGSYYQNMGTALLKAGKLKEASDSYDLSAKTNPAGAGSVYYNEAANLFNMNKQDEAATAADKAIAADPKRADAYYIKAQALVQHVTVDEKTKKYVLPPGCLEAYQEYLELAPDGPHAQEVKDLLANLGQPIKNSFKAGKKG